jgi:hypothetical protein
MPGFFDASIGGLLGSGISTTIMGALFLQRNKIIEGQVDAKFDEALKIFESKRVWKQQALAELFGPLQMQFERTKRAFRRWDGKNLYLEGKIVCDANQTIQGLLLTKGHLIPPYLMNDAAKLVEHFDAWLEAYDRIRGESAVGTQPDFVFVGPQGYPFPKDAEQAFKAEFQKLQSELYNN